MIGDFATGDVKGTFPFASDAKGNVPFWSSEAAEEVHDLVDRLDVARLDALDHAGAQVVLHDLARYGCHRLLDGGKLDEDVAAVAVLLDHRRHASQLADGAEAIGSLPKAERDERVRALVGVGLTARQVSRLTGIGENTVRRALDNRH